MHKVTVHVQDSSRQPIPSLPVEVYRGTLRSYEQTPVQTKVTNEFGDTFFEFLIPTTGGQFVFVTGDASFGFQKVEANLLCRDTTVVIVFDTKDVACNETRTDTLRLTEICLYNQKFAIPDSTQILYRSGCAVPLTMTYTPLDDPFGFRLTAIDDKGDPFPGNTFTVPPNGYFRVRLFAEPRDTGTVVRSLSITGVGSGGAGMQVNLTVVVRAIACDGCPCNDTTITISFGNVQASPTQGKATQSVAFTRNNTLCDRKDQIVKGPSLPSVFSVKDPIKQDVRRGESQNLTVEFSPQAVRPYRDTIIIQRHYQDNDSVCTTLVILVGNGCEPACCIDSTNLRGTSTDRFELRLKNTRVYESGSDGICFRHCGVCGVVELNQTDSKTKGFTITPPKLSLNVGERGCFKVQFSATDDVVWPRGHGQPAQEDHEIQVTINGCGGSKIVTAKVHVDTIPILYSRCIYVWADNGQLGFNFTPPELKGSEIFDPNPSNSQITDLVVNSIIAGTSADVFIRSGWKFIRANVSGANFDFDQVSRWPNYREITTEPPNFSTSNPATFALQSVYSIRIELSGVYSYALVRVRQIDADADGKRKICLDVLYPMIKENP